MPFSVRLEAKYKSRRNVMEASFHELSELACRLDPKAQMRLQIIKIPSIWKEVTISGWNMPKKPWSSTPAIQDQTLNMAAICNEGRFAEAERFYLRAIELDPVQRKSYEGFFGFSIWQWTSRSRRWNCYTRFMTGRSIAAMMGLGLRLTCIWITKMRQKQIWKRIKRRGPN